jgi:hypothetical protein
MSDTIKCLGKVQGIDDNIRIGFQECRDSKEMLNQGCSGGTGGMNTNPQKSGWDVIEVCCGRSTAHRVQHREQLQVGDVCRSRRVVCRGLNARSLASVEIAAQ